jgi:hypothetical protein
MAFEGCHRDKPDVTAGTDPYVEETEDEILLMDVCDDCYGLMCRAMVKDTDLYYYMTIFRDFFTRKDLKRRKRRVGEHGHESIQKANLPGQARGQLI